jgi:hypothetical protein
VSTVADATEGWPGSHVCRRHCQDANVHRSRPHTAARPEPWMLCLSQPMMQLVAVMQVGQHSLTGAMCYGIMQACLPHRQGPAVHAGGVCSHGQHQPLLHGPTGSTWPADVLEAEGRVECWLFACQVSPQCT